MSKIIEKLKQNQLEMVKRDYSKWEIEKRGNFYARVKRDSFVINLLCVGMSEFLTILSLIRLDWFLLFIVLLTWIFTIIIIQMSIWRNRYAEEIWNTFGKMSEGE